MRLLNTKKKITVITLFTLIAFTFINCDEGDITESEAQVQYRREAQLNNVYTNGIVPLNARFILETTNLNSSINAFAETPTLTNLKTSQAHWLRLLSIWKNLELYNIGTVEDTFINFEINRWPTNTEIIDTYINSTSAISETFVASNGSSSKGISALEYLLFSQDTNVETLTTFTSATHAERRQQYILALSENLIIKANQWQDLWIGFQPIFTTAVQNGLSGSQNQLTNTMVTLSEQIVINKLGNALGNTNGGTINIEALENHRSGASLLSIKENTQALYNCYTGNYKEDSIKWAFNDYLDFAGAEVLSDTIEEHFINCLDKINTITVPLKEQLENNPQSILDLQSALNALEVLIKVDMANALGSTITVNSNDGD